MKGGAQERPLSSKRKESPTERWLRKVTEGENQVEGGLRKGSTNSPMRPRCAGEEKEQGNEGPTRQAELWVAREKNGGWGQEITAPPEQRVHWVTRHGRPPEGPRLGGRGTAEQGRTGKGSCLKGGEAKQERLFDAIEAARTPPKGQAPNLAK